MSRKKNYGDLLKDPRWQKKRLEIFERDDWRCVICNAGGDTLHIHHRRYADMPWNVDDNDLHTLCENCHELYHNVQKTPTTSVAFLRDARATDPEAAKEWERSAARMRLNELEVRLRSGEADIANTKPSSPMIPLKRALIEGLPEEIRKAQAELSALDANDE